MEMPTPEVHQSSITLPLEPILPLPPHLEGVIMPDLDFLRDWFVSDMYASLLAEQPEHPLIRLNDLLDFSPIVAQCQSYRSKKPQGSPETHSIEQLCRALYVKSHLYQSLRKAENGIRNDFIVRWFVGYDPYDKTLTYSTIQRFESWVQH